ncbi:LacI family DNA-binding transcriptional regulator [Actinacidiphila glaucinigra]|uniref:LacI family DNA-binding transcriptional regulator n=1 Tax=Actinacidiphila glaucinigra TaxID=235986 RepID=UPI0033C15526
MRKRSVSPTPTVNDVARIAGVSRQTVSNALNTPERLRPETLDRVLRVIKEVGYEPNRAARSLRTQASRQIGYCVEVGRDGTSNVILDRFLHALAAAAQENGYRVVICAAQGFQDELATYDEMLRTSSVDAFILSRLDPGDPRPEWLASRNAPFVGFGRAPHAPPGQLWVDVDGAAGVGAAVDHLVARGHREIAFLGMEEGSGPGQDRLLGWRLAMGRHGLVARNSARSPDTIDDSAVAAAELLRARPRPTAVVAASDTLALGCYTAAWELGLTIGRDVAVVGFDDSPAAALVQPSLTTLRQPLTEVGRAVIRLLTARLAGGPPATSEYVLLAPELIVRESS